MQKEQNTIDVDLRERRREGKIIYGVCGGNGDVQKEQNTVDVDLRERKREGTIIYGVCGGNGDVLSSAFICY